MKKKEIFMNFYVYKYESKVKLDIYVVLSMQSK